MVRKGRFLSWIFLTLLGIMVVGVAWTRASMIGQSAPELTNQVWINSAPLRLADLQGRVILLEFWTFG